MSSSQLSIEFPSKEAIGGRVKLKPQETGRGSQILTPNKLLTKLPVLLPQIKAGNNPHKF